MSRSVQAVWGKAKLCLAAAAAADQAEVENHRQCCRDVGAVFYLLISNDSSGTRAKESLKCASVMVANQDTQRK